MLKSIFRTFLVFTILMICLQTYVFAEGDAEFDSYQEARYMTFTHTAYSMKLVIDLEQVAAVYSSNKTLGNGSCRIIFNGGAYLDLDINRSVCSESGGPQFYFENFQNIAKSYAKASRKVLD